MKKITLYSHLGGLGFRTSSGDVYDSKAVVEDSDGKILGEYFLVNVDSSVRTFFRKKIKYQVEIEDDEYAAIVGEHKGYKALLIYQKSAEDNVSTWRDLMDSDFLRKNGYPRDIRSKYPNPNWNNRRVCVGINWHKGGWEWDFSAGCITQRVDEFEKFIKLFEPEEKIRLVKVTVG